MEIREECNYEQTHESHPKLRDMLDGPPTRKALLDQPPPRFSYPINPLLMICTECSSRGSCNVIIFSNSTKICAL